MSLDFVLEGDTPRLRDNTGRVFIRHEGETLEITREEWDRLYPGREPITLTGEEETKELFRGNITDNLIAMAEAAGIYECLWRPERNRIRVAEQMINPLEAGIERLRTEPERFKQLNPENGWGDYDALERFVSAVLAACREHPTARVQV